MKRTSKVPSTARKYGRRLSVESGPLDVMSTCAALPSSCSLQSCSQACSDALSCSEKLNLENIGACDREAVCYPALRHVLFWILQSV